MTVNFGQSASGEVFIGSFAGTEPVISNERTHSVGTHVMTSRRLRVRLINSVLSLVLAIGIAFTAFEAASSQANPY
jgi:hypothetical protein